jgi:hypothetical protein
MSLKPFKLSVPDQRTLSMFTAFPIVLGLQADEQYSIPNPTQAIKGREMKPIVAILNPKQ